MPTKSIKMPLEWKVIFVLGGPGVGKGTQCTLLASSYQLCHISIGDVMRAELEKPDSIWASTIRANMAEGKAGEPNMSIPLLRAAMVEKAENEGVNVFLVDGELTDLVIFSLFLKSSGRKKSGRQVCKSVTHSFM